MKFSVSKEIEDKYPELRIGIVKGFGISPKPNAGVAIEQSMRLAEENLRDSEWRTDILIQHPFIAAWRKTYQSFGVKAKSHKPTAEAMVRRVLNGEQIPKINPVVDAYLTVEVETFLPIGGYDIDRIAGDLNLRFSAGEERFTPIGGGEEYTNPGEVVYSDAQRVLTRRWNYRDCDYTKISAESSNIMLMIEAATNQIPTLALQEATELLSKRLKKFLNGDISHSMMDVASCSSMVIVEET